MMKPKTKLERAHRADRYFAVAWITLMVFFVVAGFLDVLATPVLSP